MEILPDPDLTPEDQIDWHLENILTWDFGMPVRAMEGLIEAGADAVPEVLAVLRDLEEEPRDVAALWLVIVLGLGGDARAMEPLLAWMLGEETPEAVRSAAADGLARMGSSALPALLERLEADLPEEDRLWIYAALGSMRDEGAHARLRQALETDAELVDVLANALAEHGRSEDIPLLLDTLQRCEPWQRIDVEDAVRELHRRRERKTRSLPPGTGDRDRATDGEHFDDDWRLRYRIHPGFGTVRPSWAVVGALVRSMYLRDRRPAPPVRSLEEILADAPAEAPGVEHCEQCGEAIDYPTGVPVCGETALHVALLQHGFLGRMREEHEIEDLFEVLDVVEAREMDLRARDQPRRARARRNLRDDIEECEVHRATCHWLIGEGTETIGAGRARLLTEAVRLRELHGDPEGLLEPMRPPARSEPAAGRNDPCPCGSGRKFKRCHGRPGAENDLPGVH